MPQDGPHAGVRALDLGRTRRQQIGGVNAPSATHIEHMEIIGTLKAQESLKSTGSDETGAVCQRDVVDVPLGGAEIVRCLNEEKDARGWGTKRTSAVTTQQHRAYELIEAKLDAAEVINGADVNREAEATALAAYRYPGARWRERRRAAPKGKEC
jgi:hypothetical protein